MGHHGMTDFERALVDALGTLGGRIGHLERKLDLVLRLERLDLAVDTADLVHDTKVTSLGLTQGKPVPIKPPTQRIVAQGIDTSALGTGVIPDETADMKRVRKLCYEPAVHRLCTMGMKAKELPEQVQHLRRLCEYYVLSFCGVDNFQLCVAGVPAERLHELVERFEAA